ncbi:hypothetical protein ABK040_015896 [Willaertia magna]
MQTKRIVLKSFPEGLPQESNFEVQTVELDTNLQEKELLVELLQVSVDPYLRVRINPNYPKGSFGAISVGDDIDNASIVKVLESNHPHYNKGDIVAGYSKWQLIQKLKIENIDHYQKFKEIEGIPLSYYLSVLGLPGLTAYFGVLDVLKVKKGDVIVVSAASGGVGSVAGQIAKIKGCYVVGITGGEEKIEILKQSGFDQVVNYKSANNNPKKLVELLKNVCPNGIDCYFDNTGGFILDAVTTLMNTRGRIAFCGSITSYSDNVDPLDTADLGPRLTSTYILKSLRGEGYTVLSYESEYQNAIKEEIEWIKEGKMKVLETKESGFENIPKAFVKLFTGDKIGKVVVEI